ncbi:hypothetical protein [Burkholderia gladioli]|uniref:hypothetical protein n=1 Tax=Burkholderia gladioli TaxID=28095 RepID=UPI001C5EECD2|nr:hypothetical protein [Burkholderia gladioli]MBW5286552.1 hypothetical protein [Burkholderia gladioli]
MVIDQRDVFTVEVAPVGVTRSRHVVNSVAIRMVSGEKMRNFTVHASVTSGERLESDKFASVCSDLEKVLEERTVKPFAQKKNPRRQTGACS